MLFGKHVNKFYGRYWYDFALGIFFLIMVDVVQLAVPELLGNIVKIFDKGAPTFNQSIYDNFFTASVTEHNSFAFTLLALLIIGVLMFIGRSGWRFAINGLGINIDYDLRSEMFSHAEELSVSYYKTKKTGTLMAVFNSDLEQVKSAFTDGTIFLIDFLVLGGLSLYRMFSISWQITLACAIPLILMTFSGGLVGKIIMKKYDAQLTSFEKLSDFTQEDYSGIAVVKAFVREKYQASKFHEQNTDYKKKNINYIRFSLALDSIIGLLINAVFVITIMVGSYQSLFGNSGLQVSDLVKFVGYLDALIWPMFAIASLINIISKSYASLHKVDEFLDAPIDLKDTNDESGLPAFNGDVLFKDFNFAYPDNNKSMVLQNVTLHVKPGDNIGIVGRTGSGKSTLVKVLLKIYNIEEGHLFFNNVDINKWPARDIRDNIGYVAQNAFLFSDQIRNNIAFGNSSLELDDVIKAADFACVDNAINDFKEGYETVIGEKGTTLSGGQKQRIAMARAIVKDPMILILDDSVSAVDSDTEKKILKNIKELRKGKTTFIVSSRISSIEQMDNIICMDEGRIVGIGSHEELLKSCPLYADIVHLQELEKEEK